MCCTMVWEEQWFFPGIVVGVIGIAIAATAYPLYTCITKKQRKKTGTSNLKAHRRAGKIGIIQTGLEAECFSLSSLFLVKILQADWQLRLECGFVFG